MGINQFRARGRAGSRVRRVLYSVLGLRIGERRRYTNFETVYKMVDSGLRIGILCMSGGGMVDASR